MEVTRTSLRTGRTPVHAAELEISSIHIQKASTRGERHETTTASRYRVLLPTGPGCEASTSEIALLLYSDMKATLRCEKVSSQLNRHSRNSSEISTPHARAVTAPLFCYMKRSDNAQAHRRTGCVQ